MKYSGIPYAQCLRSDTRGIIAAIFVPAIPPPKRGNIKNQTRAMVSAVTKVSVRAQFGPQSDGAMPA